MTPARQVDDDRADEAEARRRLADPDDPVEAYDDVRRELAFECMIERGLADVRAGRTISDEEMEKRVHSW